MGISVYVQVNLFAIMVLLILYVNSKSKLPYSRNSRRFRAIIVLGISILLLDTFTWEFNGKGGNLAGMVLQILNGLYLALSALVCFSWFLYTYADLHDDRDLVGNKKLFLLVLIPLVAFWLLLAIDSRCVFVIDAQNFYRRGALFWLQYVVGFGYMVAATMMSLLRRRKEYAREKRDEDFYLACFLILPVIGGIIQISHYGLVTVWPFMVASIILVYINLQRTQISLDTMTGLNNRRRFNRYLQMKMEETRNKNPWYLILIDVDDFKSINDRYGHMAGDMALKRMAGILKKIFGKMNAFLGRYGGDEFVILLECRKKDEIEYAICLLKNVMEAEAKHGNCPYQLSCSVGYVKYDSETMKTKEDIIAAADEQMYLQKKSRKA